MFLQGSIAIIFNYQISLQCLGRRLREMLLQVAFLTFHPFDHFFLCRKLSCSKVTGHIPYFQPELVLLLQSPLCLLKQGL